MKKSIITIIFLIILSQCFAQNNSGIITYKKDVSGFYENTKKKLKDIKKQTQLTITMF